METPLRLLLVAEPDAAEQALARVRRHVGAEAARASTADALAAALRDERWDAALVVPGGPVADADVARLVGPSGVPLVVVAGAVPAGLARAAALVLGESALEGLSFALASLAASGPADFVASANAALADGPSATAAPVEPGCRGDGEAARERPGTAAMPDAAPGSVEPLRHLGAELVRDLPIGVYRSTPGGRILYANKALAHVLRCADVDELQRLDVRRDLRYPKDAFDAEMQRHGVVRNLVVRWTDRLGRAVCTRENARAVFGADGRVVYVEGTMEDITAEDAARASERRQARQHEAALRFAEAADRALAPEELYAPAAEALLETTGADFALVVLHAAPAPGEPAESGHNTIGAVAGRLAPHPGDPQTDDAFGSLALGAETRLADDLTGERPAWLPPAAADLLHAQGTRSLSCVPMLRGGQPFGALISGYDAPHTVSDGERAGAEALAWHLAGHLARHTAESRRRDAEATLHVLAERGPQVLYRLRYTPDEAVFDYLSPFAEALTGYPPDALALAGGLAALVEEREVFAGRGLTQRAVAGEPVYRALYRLRSRHAGLRWVENHAVPWTAADGTPLGLVGTLHDVTERREAEAADAAAASAALARQAALVALAHEADPDALARRAAEAAFSHSQADAASVWQADGSAMVCRALCAAGGVPEAAERRYPAEAFAGVLGLLCTERVLAVDDAADDPRVDEAGLRELVDAFGVDAFVVAPVRVSGEVVGLVAFHGAAGRTAGPWSAAETDFAAALADALALGAERTERARAEADLRRSEARYRVLSELASDYAFAMHVAPDGHETIAWATDAFARVSGYTPDEVADVEGLKALVASASRGVVRAARAALLADGQAAFTAQIHTAAGETRWVHHVARVGERYADGTATVYHAGCDATERVEAQAELVRAREAAEEVARLKSAFLANMSHEIRTPLTGILGFAELLEADVADEHREYVDCIATAGRRLLDTLNSVLDLARLEAAEATPPHAGMPDATPVDVGAAVAETVRLLVPLADRKGLDLTVDVEPGCTVPLDRASLDRITTNLVGNAIKFTQDGGVAVTVGRVAAPDGSARVALRVADTGIGISEAFLPRLFDEFRQETDGHGRSHEGSGLGLAITSRLVELLGGHIDVESRRPGGTTFTVRLPTAPAAAPAPAAEGPGPHGPLVALPARTPPHAPTDSARTPMFDFRLGFQTASEPFGDDRLVDVSLLPTGDPEGSLAAPSHGPPPDTAAAHALPGDGLAGTAEPRLALPEPADGPLRATPTGLARTTMLVRPARDEASESPAPDAADGRPAVLVVEDNADTRMLLERILHTAYAVTAVADARSALVAMNARRYRGLVLDINLGGRETGTDVLRVARALEGYDRVFAIALTAYALPGDRERLIEQGFDEYLSKPFSRQALLDALAAGVRA